MAQPYILPSFGAGELAPSMYGRVDLQKYHVGAALLRNFFTDYRGGASSRFGTKFIGQCKDSSKANRLIPFEFNTLQAYVLVFGDKSMRVVKDGGYVLEPTQTITNITQLSSGLFTYVNTGYSGSYSNGDLVYISGVSGMTQMNGKFGIVRNATATTFTLEDMYGNSIDTSGYSAYTSGGTIGRVFTLTTPYAAEDLALLKFAQSADVMTITHPSYTPYKLTRTQHYAWTLTAVTFSPTASAPLNVTATHNGTGSTYGSTYYNYVVTAIVDGTESVASSVASCNGFAMGQNTGAHVTIAWNAVTGADSYNIYRSQENLASTVPSGALLGYVGATTPAATNTFIDTNIVPDFTRCPPQANNPFTTAGNPACVTYYQQRQVFGGMANAPEQIDFSKTGDYFNMDYAIPSVADDNIEITIASQQVNAIKHMIAMQSLIVLTSSGAWKIDGGNAGQAITPSNVQATPQAYNGCSDVPPIIINYDILYVQSKGSIVRDLSYNFYVNIFTGTDITLLANHLFYGHQITEWCYAEEPFKIVWCVRDDGILLALTFLKEQDVMAWTHHDTDGRFKSICTIPEGNTNAVYVIVQRFVNGKYLQYIERMADRYMKGDPTIGLPADCERAFCVDSGLQSTLTYPDETITPVGTYWPNSAGNEQFGDAQLIGDPLTTGEISAIAILNGGSNYGTYAAIRITDPTGTGISISNAFLNGSVYYVVVNACGTGYTNPTIEAVDPNGQGSGAVLRACYNKQVLFSDPSGLIKPWNIGNVIRVNDGIGIITNVEITFNGANCFAVDMTTAMTSLWPAESGAWSIAPLISSVSGLDHLEGRTVSILADGNVSPSQTVVNGSVSLDRPHSLVTVGLPYTCQLQSLYLDISGGDTIQGKRKKINAVTVRLQDSKGLFVGPDFDNMTEIKERNTQIMGQPIKLFTGDQRVVISPSWNLTGQICVQQDYPLPVTVLALIPEITVGDTP